MIFLSPGFLWLLLFLPAFLLPKGARRRPGHACLRLATAAALIVALAHPVQVERGSGSHLVVLVDRSGSLTPDAEAALEAQLLELKANRPADVLWHSLDFGDGVGSDLSQALGHALQWIPAGDSGEILLLSDGLATVRDWKRLPELSQRGLQLSVLPVASPDSTARIVAAKAPGFHHSGLRSQVSVQLEGDGGSLRLQLVNQDGGETLASLDIEAPPGRSEWTLEFTPPDPGFLAFELDLRSREEEQASRPPSRWSMLLAVQDPLPVLLLQGGPAQDLAHHQQLLGPGFRLIPAEEAQAELADYPLTWLDDRSAESVPAVAQQEMLEAVVHGGGGLLMSGGRRSFGPGGWADSPLADVLPVECMQKEEKRDPSTTLVVIIDTSGSMGGNRVQLAKEVARLALQRLLPHDKAGIVEFYGAKHWAAPIQPASNVLELERALNRMSAGGGTVILPAIEEAFYALQNIQTRYKHVLVLTDGGVESGDFETLLRAMSDKGITVSTVLIGSQAHSEFLVNMANWGKGRFYSVPNRFNLPEVLLKQPASTKLPAYRPGTHAVSGHGGRRWWGDVDLQQLPPVLGYVETRLQPGAEILLETTEGSHPVLASWRFGSGRVSALTTEPVGPGTDSWADWQGASALMRQVFQRTTRQGHPDFHFSLERQRHQVTLRAQRRRANQALPQWNSAGEPERSTPFLEIAPGLFEARFLHDWNLDLKLTASSTRSEQVVRLASRAGEGRSPEHQVAEERAFPLLGSAVLSGGQVWSGQISHFRWPQGTRLTSRSWVPMFAGLALLLLLVELFWRRRPAFHGGDA